MIENAPRRGVFYGLGAIWVHYDRGSITQGRVVVPIPGYQLDWSLS
jgi:hypothetical protein